MEKDKESVLLGMLQPPEYVSKIKLLCNYCIFEIKKIKD